MSKYLPNQFDQYYRLVSSDDVMHYITGKGLSVKEAQAKFDLFMEVNSAYKDLGYFEVKDLQGEHIGDCKIEWHRPERKVLEVGYILKKDYWGKGYGKAICRALVNKGKALFPEADIIGIIDPANTASRKILQSVGMSTYFVGMENGLATEKLKLERN